MAQIDKINHGGQTYEFVDQTARDANTALSARVGRINEAQTEALQQETQKYPKRQEKDSALTISQMRTRICSIILQLWKVQLQ